MARAIVKNLGVPVKNYIINGGMQVSQRGVVAAANNAFRYGGADRFAVGPFFSASSGGQIAQQTFTTGVLTQQMQAVVSLNNTGAGSVQFYTRLEGRDVSRLNGKTVTWSMLAYQTSGLTLQFGCEINRPTTTVDNYGAITSVTSFANTPVPTHTLTRVTYTYTFGAADAEKGLELRSFYSVPSTLSNVGYYIGEMQLEEAAYRSPLEVVPFEVELAKCQRYYEKSYNLETVPGTSTSLGILVKATSGDSAGNHYIDVAYKVTKRASTHTARIWNSTGVADQATVIANNGAQNSTIFSGNATCTVDETNVSGFYAHAFSYAAYGNGRIVCQWTADAEL